jgi:signal peptide peptidase SppA
MRIPEFLLSEPLAVHAPSLAGWMMRRERIEAILMGADPRGASRESQSSAPDPARFDWLAAYVNGRRPYQVTNGIAAIHANEILARTHTTFDKAYGDTHYNDLISELGQAAGDDKVRGIRLDISSPGGSAVGAPEAAAAVLAARQQKPVVSHIETVGASAAYYLAAASNAIIVSPSAIVGSVGTISMFADISAMLEKMGVKVNLMTPKVSDLKAAGNQVRPMTDDEQDYLQDRLESINAKFTGWVQSNRPGVSDDAMRGQWFSGQDAVDQGLADCTGSVDDANAALDALIAYSNGE